MHWFGTALCCERNKSDSFLGCGCALLFGLYTFDVHFDRWNLLWTISEAKLI